MTIKGLLNGFHNAVKWLFHIIIIPVGVVVKALISGLTHLEAELEKF